MNKIFGILIIATLLAGVAFAENSGNFQQARYDNLNCSVQFAISHANSVIAADSNTSDILNGKISELNSALSTLTTNLSADKNTAFKSQILSVQELTKGLNQLAKEQLRNLIGPKHKDARGQIRSEFDTAKTTFTDCVKNASLNFANARVTAYNTILSNWEEKIAKFSDKNMDTTEMTQIVADARAQVIAPINNAIATGDYNIVRDAVKGYCLFNGCSTLNFHFAAKMEIAKFNMIIAKALDRNVSADHKATLDSAQSSIDAADAALKTVGDGAYTDDNKKEVWDAIKECSSTLKEALKPKNNSADTNKRGDQNE